MITSSPALGTRIARQQCSIGNVQIFTAKSAEDAKKEGSAALFAFFAPFAVYQHC
jgi:hypothetical protein